MDGMMYELDEGGLFQSAEWKPFYSVMTNIGMLRFHNLKSPLSEKPRLMAIRTMKLEAFSSLKICYRQNIFQIDYDNEKG